MSQSRSLKVLLAILALVICTGTMQAAAVLSGPAGIALVCDTATGAAVVNVPIALVSGTTALLTKVTSSAGLAAVLTSGIPTSGGPVVITATDISAGRNVTSTTATVASTFSFSIAPGCMGTLPVTTAPNTGLTFTPSTGQALFIPVTMTITTSNGSALVPSPSSLSFTCNKTTGAVTAAQPVAVTSAATGGTPFTIGSLAAVSTWLAVSPGGLANASAINLTVTVTGGAGAGCALLAAGTTTFNIPLLSGPATAQVTKIVPVTLIVGPTSPIIPGSTSVALTYAQGSASGTWVSVVVGLTSAPSGVYVAVDGNTVPSWLSVTPSTTNTPLNLTFLPGTGVAALNRGNYTANVHLKVSGYLDYVLPVTIQVNSAAATLSLLQNASSTLVMTAANTYTENLNWTVGNSSYPSFALTPVSSDTPIAFSVATSGALLPVTSTTQGLAYNFGSPFTVSFPISIFATLVPSTTAQLGQVVVTGGGATITVNIKLYVNPPAATISTLTPSVLPTSASGVAPFTVVIYGSGFVTGAGATVAGVVPSAGVLVVDPNIATFVQDTKTIVLTITVPTGPDPYLPFNLAVSSSVIIGVCNPQVGGTICSSPGAGGTAILTIGINPIISAVTSASSYIEASAPILPIIAPYDILTIFGTNFCVSAATGCVAGSTNALLYGATNTTTFAYPTTLSPDAAGVTQRNLTVNFYQHGTTTLIAAAPLLFATNNQINLMAPSALAAKAGSTVDVVVSFGYGVSPAATLLKSQAYTVNVAATDPGVFTIGGDGQGDAAALANANYALIAQAAPGIVRTTATNSDIVDLYVTGLGVPDSTYAGVDVGTGASKNCMPAATYWANDTGTTSDDGLVIVPSFFSAGAIQPCFLLAGANIPTVSIGGQPAVVLFAGWVQGAVAGLYQINVQLPSAVPTLPGGAAAFTYATTNPVGNAVGNAPATGVVALPVFVTAGGKASQAGAAVWVEQSLLATVTCATGGMLTSPAFVASNPVYTVTIGHGVTLPLAANAVTVVGTQGAAAGPVYSFAATAPGTVNGLTISAFPDDLAVDGTTGILSGTPTIGSAGLNIGVTVTDATSGFVGNVIITLNVT